MTRDPEIGAFMRPGGGQLSILDPPANRLRRDAANLRYLADSDQLIRGHQYLSGPRSFGSTWDDMVPEGWGISPILTSGGRPQVSHGGRVSLRFESAHDRPCRASTKKTATR